MRHRTALSLIFVVAAIIWYALMEYLRHRSWKQHRNNPPTPSTQGLSFLGSFGGFVLMLIALLIRLFG